METVRAKFSVTSVKKFGNGSANVRLGTVYSETPEDNQFSKAKPSGFIEITIDNPTAQGFLVPGKNFYVDFTLAP